jgi:hypothetical protein
MRVVLDRNCWKQPDTKLELHLDLGDVLALELHILSMREQRARESQGPLMRSKG